MGKEATYYQILGVSPSAKHDEIRAAYLAKARKLHPDNFQNASKREQTRSEELMRELNQAWSTLSNKEKRSEYDLKISTEVIHPSMVVRMKNGFRNPLRSEQHHAMQLTKK